MDILQSEWLVRLLTSGLLSGIIGLEREAHGREAGLRTMILVGMGTTAIFITSVSVPTLFAGTGGSPLRIDPGRIASGIVTGIGFLGAGAIVKDHRRIRGLTTAACMWVVTSIGLACGCGLYAVATWTSLCSVATLYVLKGLENILPRDRYSEIIVHAATTDTTVDSIRRTLGALRMEVHLLDIERDIPALTSTFRFILSHRSAGVSERAVKAISEMPGVLNVKWLKRIS